MRGTGTRIAGLAIAVAALALLSIGAMTALRALRIRAPQVHGDVAIALGDGASMVFVEITPGRLDVPERLGGLFPGYELEICVPYFIGATEVTEAQWTAVMGEDPPTPPARNPHRPVVLAYGDVKRFVAHLDRIVAPQYEASLPTEVQWEYR